MFFIKMFLIKATVLLCVNFCAFSYTDARSLYSRYYFDYGNDPGDYDTGYVNVNGFKMKKTVMDSNDAMVRE